MLGRNSYTQDELDACRVAMERQIEAYRRLTAAVGPEAVDGFEARFCNNLVLALDRYFVHRVRAVSGKDGNPLNEVELIADGLMLHDGALPASTVIRYAPERSVLGLDAGDRIALTADDFERLSAAFLAEIEKRFV